MLPPWLPAHKWYLCCFPGPNSLNLAQTLTGGGPICWKFLNFFWGQIWTSQQISQWGRGPVSQKFSKSKNPNKIENFLSSDLDLPANFLMGGGGSLQVTCHRQTHADNTSRAFHDQKNWIAQEKQQAKNTVDYFFNNISEYFLVQAATVVLDLVSCIWNRLGWSMSDCPEHMNKVIFFSLSSIYQISLLWISLALSLMVFDSINKVFIKTGLSYQK